MTIVRFGILFSFLTLFGSASVVQARPIANYGFATSYEQSALVVIAHPLSKTVETSERTAFEGIGITAPDGARHDVPAIGVETKFKVLEVLKGDPQTKQFVLHHFIMGKLPDYVLFPGIDAPLTVTFDPEDPKRSRDFLLFLVKEPDGRYAPFGGQTDPNDMSVFVLDEAP